MDVFNPILAAVNAWQPQHRYRDEKGYRDDLKDYLLRTLGALVKTEARRRLVDIEVRRAGLLGIGEVAGIELKADLQSKGERNGLVGQIEDDLLRFRRVICVLCGDTDPEQLSLFMQWARRKMFSLQQLHVVTK